MAVPAKGLFYAPAPPPQSGGEHEVKMWCVQEFHRIANAMQEGRAEFVRVDVLKKEPEKRFPGLLAYFAASIVGATEGAYEYRSDNTWHKL